MASAKLHRNTVIAALKDLSGTVLTNSSTSKIRAAALTGLSADLFNDGYVKFLDGVQKGEEKLITNMSADASGYMCLIISALTGSAPVGSTFVISPNHTAASRRKYILAGEADPGMDASMLERFIYTGYLDPAAQVNTRNLSKFTFKTEIIGSSTPTTATDLGDLIEAAGFTEAISASDVNYTPHSGAIETVTLYMWKDGVRFVLRYGVADFTLSFTAGGYGEINWTVVGKYSAPTTVANVTPTYTGARTPIPIANCSIAIGSYHPILSAFEIAIGNNVVIVDDAECAEAMYGARISARTGAGKMTLMFPTLATYNAFANLVANTREAITVQVGSVSGNIWRITIPQAQIVAVPLGDKDGIITLELSFVATISSGNDFVSFETL